jgi:hypothetical protein
MSELQAALLMIGFGVIIAVYAFGWWQQRRYRRKFGAAFKASRADALYAEKLLAGHPQESGAKLAGQVQQSASARMVDEAIGEAIITDVEIAEVSVVELSITNLLDDSCSLLNVRSDFIIELHLAEPSPAPVLDGLWQRKFDFRKPVQVCGLTLVTKKWERAIAESQVLYARFVSPCNWWTEAARSAKQNWRISGIWCWVSPGTSRRIPPFRISAKHTIMRLNWTRFAPRWIRWSGSIWCRPAGVYCPAGESHKLRLRWA